MYALAVIASLMLLGKIASEHESTEYDFLLGDDDMMGSMDRSKNRDTTQKQYQPHSHLPRAPGFQSAGRSSEKKFIREESQTQFFCSLVAISFP